MLSVRCFWGDSVCVYALCGRRDKRHVAGELLSWGGSGESHAPIARGDDGDIFAIRAFYFICMSRKSISLHCYSITLSYYCCIVGCGKTCWCIGVCAHDTRRLANAVSEHRRAATAVSFGLCPYCREVRDESFVE